MEEHIISVQRLFFSFPINHIIFPIRDVSSFISSAVIPTFTQSKKKLTLANYVHKQCELVAVNWAGDLGILCTPLAMCSHLAQ